jgi:TQXA domain-containing protein/LPXTG-motif cell wall-anchored protein
MLARLGVAVIAGGLISLMATGAAAAAEAPVTGVAGAAGCQNDDNTCQLHAKDGRNYGAAVITLTINGKAAEAYCIDLHHGLERGGTYQETAWKEATVAKLDKVQWLLGHSVPNVKAQSVLDAASVPKADYKDFSDEKVWRLAYTATQGAIWHFSDGLEVVAHEGKEYGVIKAVYDYLVGHAGSESEPAPTLSITPATATGEVGAKLGPYTVKSSAPAKVSVTGGKAVDANGAEVTGPVADGGKFWLTSGAAGKVSVEASSTGKVPTGRVFTFTQKPNERQKVILAGVAETKLSAHATGTFTPKGAAPSSPAAPTLPVTGASAVGAAIAGVALLAGGGVLIMLLRRRRIKFMA